MSIRQSLFKIRGVDVQVFHKNIKNLHLNVLPPNGTVRVSAPINMSEDAIRTFLAKRFTWIKKKQATFIIQERQTPRKYIAGESHYLLGKRYRLEIQETTTNSHIEIVGKKKALLKVRRGSTCNLRNRVFEDFYRNELRKVLDPLMCKWQNKIGVIANFWGIRKMKTRWGTCDNISKRIWFNLELAKKPISAIEYVVVHELTHLLERNHNKDFVKLMDKYLPQWRSERDKLNMFILSHEHWNR